jgi:hypothetical protein
MREVLADQLKALNEEAAGILAQGAGRDAFDASTALKPLVEKHVQAAEKKLANTLTDRQLRVWRAYRETNRTLRINRREEIQMKTPEERSPQPGGSEF